MPALTLHPHLSPDGLIKMPAVVVSILPTPAHAGCSSSWKWFAAEKK